jgi:hypothetical protein
LYQKQRQFYITGARRHRQFYRQSIDRLRGWSTELDSADFASRRGSGFRFPCNASVMR